MKSNFTLFLIAMMLGSAQLIAQVLPVGSTCNDPIALVCGSTMSGSTQNIPNDNSSSGAVTCISSVGTGGQLWYSYSDEGGNLITLSTCGTTNMDTKIHVYSGVCGALLCVASNDDACSMQSSVSFVTSSGTNYLIRVGGFGSISGTFGLSVSCGANTGGCTDPNASNFDPSATFNDGSCEYDGCTDPSAINFDPSATNDDGSCEYCDGEGSISAQLYICTFSNGANVSLTLVDSQGNVAWQSDVLGNNVIQYNDICLQAGECYTAVMSNLANATGWYNGYFWVTAGGIQVVNESLNPDATTESVMFSADGTCSTIFGCTDPEAVNYNAAANTDDGSCILMPECETGTVYAINFVAGAFPSECSYNVLDASGQIIFSGQGQYNNSNIQSFVCLEDGCYTVIMYDSFGDGWNGCYLEFTGGGSSTQFTFDSGDAGAGVFGVNTTECIPNVSSGCTNPNADNYDPTAIFSDGSCIFSGCTDQGAINFDPYANLDDGSCEYCNGEGSVIAALYLCTFSNGSQVELEIVDDQGNVVYYGNNFGNVAIMNTQICLLPGVCYTANMINNTGPLGWYNGYFWVSVNGIQIINDGLEDGEQYQSVQFSIDGTCGPVFGCTDPNALNYNAEATSDDGSCVYPVAGCTDSAAINYNPAATADDGSCIYAEDCENTMVAFQFDPGIFASESSYDIIDANGVIVMSGYGYATTYACLPDGCYTINMYDTFGDGWDGSGYLTISANNAFMGTFTLASGTFGTAGFGINAEGCTPSVPGCTDPAALNYNPSATEDDGSCFYPESCEGNLLTITIITQAWGSEISWDLVSEDGTVYASGSGYNSWNYYYEYACVPDGCYQLVMNDSWGDGWNGGYYTLSSSNAYSEGSLLYGSTAMDLIGFNSDCGGEVEGCTDPTAVNFDPAATMDDGSCIYNNGYAPGVGLGLELGFSMYPNPANAGIVVNLTNLNPEANIEVRFMSIDGKVLRSEVFGNSETSRVLPMDIHEFAAGFYLVQVSNGQNAEVMSLIKE